MCSLFGYLENFWLATGMVAHQTQGAHRSHRPPRSTALPRRASNTRLLRAAVSPGQQQTNTPAPALPALLLLGPATLLAKPALQVNLLVLAVSARSCFVN
jgi:hypothetical protein